jgi:hypothetical protein
MSTVDNLEILLPFIKPASADDFYYLQILQRKKENPELGSNSRVIKNYYIKSQEELIKKYGEIKMLCQVFNARASLRLNKRSFEQVAFKTLINNANNMSQRDYINMTNSYDRACGMGHSEEKGGKTWILDVDANEDRYLDWTVIKNMTTFMSKVLPVGEKELAFGPSKTGVHIITKPFDLRLFSIEYPDISIHKDNPTNLFIP